MNFFNAHTERGFDLSRRQVGQSALAACVLVGVPGMGAFAQQPSALLNTLLPLQNDSVMVVQLWPTLTEQVRRAAVVSRCDLPKQELTQIEWDATFQSLIAQDARGFHKIPLFNRFFIQPWVRSIESDWAALSAQEKKRWTDWLAKPEAKPVLQSLRAEQLIEIMAKDNWAVDDRTGKWIATAPILVAQALTDIEMKEVFDRAVAQTNNALGKQWSRVKPFAAMSPEDAKWLTPLSKALHENAQKIYDNFEKLATRRWPERETWLNGDLGNVPALCEFSIKGDAAKEFREAAFSFNIRDYAPATFAHYCGKRG
ncbi:hypothetical protein [Ottowia thiooxydans]|uniref:hypothetical protein n=1 Tax=Ottowia thiooxydans TaxID=219182 RepID=UPI001469D772|nr:hypothetical protein [Ottowia thiooxydans]